MTKHIRLIKILKKMIKNMMMKRLNKNKIIKMTISMKLQPKRIKIKMIKLKVSHIILIIRKIHMFITKSSRFSVYYILNLKMRGLQNLKIYLVFGCIIQKCQTMFFTVVTRLRKKLSKSRMKQIYSMISSYTHYS